MLALLGCCSAPATAQQISLQSYFIYTLSEIEFSDGHSESSGIFSPWYFLTVRGPLIGGTDTQVELGITGYNSGDPEAAVDQRNYRLAVFAQGDRLSLLATAIRDVNRTSIVRPSGTDLTSLAVSDVYSLNGSLRYPSYPTVDFQYQKSMLRGEDEQTADSTDYSIGARHEWGPLQVFAERMKQESAFSETSVESTRYGVTLDRSLLPTVRFRLEHFSDVALRSQGGMETETQSLITTVRVSALPTPFLVADGELSRTEHQAIGGIGGATGTGWGHALHLRSEVLPGIRLDVSKNGQQYETPIGTTSTDQTSVSIGVQLHRTTTILARWSASKTSDPIGLGDRQTRGDEDRRVSIASSLSPRMELFAEYGIASQAYQEGRRDRTTASIGGRWYVSPRLSLDASVSEERNEISLEQGSSSDSNQHLDLSASWLPSDLWRLAAGVSIARSRASLDSSSVTPYLNVGWEVDPATSLTLRYYAQRLEQEDGLTSANTSSVLGGRLMRRLPNGGILEVNYDYRRALSSLFVWERWAELRYGRSF